MANNLKQINSGQNSMEKTRKIEAIKQGYRVSTRYSVRESRINKLGQSFQEPMRELYSISEDPAKNLRVSS
jgi:hypothetical protein